MFLSFVRFHRGPASSEVAPLAHANSSLVRGYASGAGFAGGAAVKYPTPIVPPHAHTADTIVLLLVAAPSDCGRHAVATCWLGLDFSPWASLSLCVL